MVSGSVILDNLPWWLALPAGLVAGVVIGFTLVQSETSAVTIGLGMLALGVGLWLGLSTPRPVPRQKTLAHVHHREADTPESDI